MTLWLVSQSDVYSYAEAGFKQMQGKTLLIRQEPMKAASTLLYFKTGKSFNINEIHFMLNLKREIDCICPGVYSNVLCFRHELLEADLINGNTTLF